MPTRCYLCGGDGDTRDHIPPKSFFPEPRPTNLITVPCCRKCNGGFSDDDDVARLYLSAHIARSVAGNWIWENKVVPNTIKRRPAVVDHLLKTMKDVQIQTEIGLLDATTYEIEPQRMERFMVRIAKGLLRHHYADYDYGDAQFTVRMIDPKSEHLNDLELVRDLLPYFSRGADVFQYRGGLTETKRSGLWLMVFYGATMFMVAHTRNGWGRNS